jgi:hypothetical protein
MTAEVLIEMQRIRYYQVASGPDGQHADADRVREWCESRLEAWKTVHRDEWRNRDGCTPEEMARKILGSNPC